LAKTFLWGRRSPKANYEDVGSPASSSTNYDSMNKYYRWWRQDRLVRRCTNLNAFFSTIAPGFETELQATKVEDGVVIEDTEALSKYKDVKPFIDGLNTTLGMDRILFVSQIKRSVYGQMGWEIVLDDEGLYPDYLLSLQSEKLKPKVSKTFDLEGFTYGNRRKLKYQPEEVFYMTNLQLEEDYLGVSDIEPIVNTCNARNVVFWENYPEIVRTLWANADVASVDTSGMSDAAETTFLRNLGGMLRAGKAIAVNKSVEVSTIARKADIAGLRQMNEDFKEEIIGNYGTPKFLLGRPVENRATAYAEIEAYVEGPIAGIQTELSRFLEDWYKQWIAVYLKEEHSYNVESDEAGGALPVEIKVKFKTIRTADILDRANAVASLWGPGGMGPLGLRQDYKKVWELMDWPLEELEEESETSEEDGTLE